MIIKNARWLNPDGSFIQSNIKIKHGKIVDFPTSVYSKNDQIFDANDLSILPGAIDPHVHFREPGQLYKEGINSGSKAALCGGVTTILDMPNNKPPCSTLKRLVYKKELFRKKSLVNWGIMYHTTSYNTNEVQNQIASAKIYMAKSSALPAITFVDTLTYLFKRFPMISIHAEDESEFDTSSNKSPLHHVNRPRTSITSALNKIEIALKSINKKNRPRIVICHMNTSDEVKWISRMKNDGFDVWGETCPHYLFFTQDNYIDQGTIFQVNPPIRTKEDQMRLREGISDGVIDFMGTDHAPHSLKEKQSAKPPSGIAAIEWFIPQMLHFVDEGIISWQRFHQLICEKSSQCYSIKGRDGIKKGNFADFTFVKKSNVNIAKTDVHTKVGLNLYKDFYFKWQVVATVINGILKYDGSSFYEEIKGKEV